MSLWCWFTPGWLLDGAGGPDFFGGPAAFLAGGAGLGLPGGPLLAGAGGPDFWDEVVVGGPALDGGPGGPLLFGAGALPGGAGALPGGAGPLPGGAGPLPGGPLLAGAGALAGGALTFLVLAWLWVSCEAWLLEGGTFGVGLGVDFWDGAGGPLGAAFIGAGGPGAFLGAGRPGPGLAAFPGGALGAGGPLALGGAGAGFLGAVGVFIDGGGTCGVFTICFIGADGPGGPTLDGAGLEGLGGPGIFLAGCGTLFGLLGCGLPLAFPAGPAFLNLLDWILFPTGSFLFMVSRSKSLWRL